MKPFACLSQELVVAEAGRCLLCYDAPCSKACPHKTKPNEFIRALHFDNEAGALDYMKDVEVSLTCVENCTERYCEKACTRGKLDHPIQIHDIHEYLARQNEKGEDENAKKRFVH